jgi:hypothetical protein
MYVIPPNFSFSSLSLSLFSLSCSSILNRILSQTSDYEDACLLGNKDLQCSQSEPTLRRNIHVPPFLVAKGKAASTVSIGVLPLGRDTEIRASTKPCLNIIIYYAMFKYLRLR